MGSVGLTVVVEGLNGLAVVVGLDVLAVVVALVDLSAGVALVMVLAAAVVELDGSALSLGLVDDEAGADEDLHKRLGVNRATRPADTSAEDIYPFFFPFFCRGKGRSQVTHVRVVV